MKVLFILTAVIYGFLGFSARLSVSYIDMLSFDNAIKTNLAGLIFISIIVGVLFSLWFKRAFPYGYSKQYKFVRLIGLPIIFSCLAFAIHQGWLFTLNTILITQNDQTIVTITKKRIVESRRSSSYRLFAYDLGRKNRFEFKVGKDEYYKVNPEDMIELDLKKGVFNIYYADQLNK